MKRRTTKEVIMKKTLPSRMAVLLLLLLSAWTEVHAMYTYYINSTETEDNFTYNYWYRKYSGMVDAPPKRVRHNGASDVTTSSFAFKELTALAVYPYHYQLHITIPSSVSSIASGAFADCTTLTRVDIPSSIGDGILRPATLKSGAFSNCPLLTDVYTEMIYAIPDGAFDDFIYEHATLHVPYGKKDTYQNLGGWKKFSQIIDDIGDDGRNEGDVFTSEVNGKSMSFTVKDKNRRTCWVGRFRKNANDNIEAAIDTTVSGEITIPDEVDGYTVEGIGERAFSFCRRITRINIPETVHTIGTQAFRNCERLQATAIPKNVTSLGDYNPFAGCKALQSLVVAEDNTTYDSRDNCNGIIETATNKLVTGTANMTIPSTVRSIGTVAFSNLDILTQTIPNGVTSIEIQAFAGCRNLKDITIPQTVTSIEKEICMACDQLASIVVEAGNPVYDSRDNCNAVIQTATNTLIQGCKGTVIPTSVKHIGESAFASCLNLPSVNLPEGLESLGTNAFWLCASLEEITIPASVQTISDYAFEDCVSLENVYAMAESPVGMNSNAFNVNYAHQDDMLVPTTAHFTTATLHVPAGAKAKYQVADGWKNFQNIVEMEPTSPIIQFADAEVKRICVENWDTDGDGELSEEEAAAVTDLNGAFARNTTIGSFNELKFFTGLTMIPDNSFYYCSTLKQIRIPKGVKELGTGAMWLCTSLTQIDLPDGLITINPGALAQCKSLESINIPSSVETIGFEAFHGCSSLESIVIPSLVKEIAHQTFAECTSLKNVQLPAMVTSFGNYAFWGCSSLSNIDIPSGVTALPEGVFFDCTALESVSLPSSLIEIGLGAFECCTSLSKVSLPGALKVIDDEAFCKTALKEVALPSSLETLGAYAFYDCTQLQDITIPEGVTKISEGVFERCTNLGAANLPSTLTEIDRNAFYLCTNLQGISIPSGVTKIAECVFMGCTSLASVTLPSYLTEVGDSAFYACASLPNINIPYGAETIGKFAFWNCTTLNNVSLPTTLKTIKDGAFIRTGLTQVALPSSLQTIGTQAFAGCANLTSLTIPANVASMGHGIVSLCSNLKALTVASENPYFRSSGNGIIDRATNMLVQACPKTIIPTDIIGIGEQGFVMTDGVEEINIPENIKSLGLAAFEECKDLKRVTIPAGIQSIGDEAFLECVVLEQVTVLNPVPVPIADNVFHMTETWNEDKTEATTGDFTTATLYVPYGSKAAYQAADGWKNFHNIVEMEPDYRPGDLNGDDLVNGTDLVALVSVIMGQDEQTKAADVNADGLVNGTDYVALVDLILNEGNASVKAYAGREDKPLAEATIGIEPFGMESAHTGMMTITLDNPDMDVTMVQLDLTMPRGLRLQPQGDGYAVAMTGRTTWKDHSVYANHIEGESIRLLLASAKNTLIKDAQGGILRLTLVADSDFEGGDILLDNILCTSPSQQECRPQACRIHLNKDDVTGIGEVGAIASDSKNYNMAGQRVSNLQKGLHIIGGKKRIVR